MSTSIRRVVDHTRRPPPSRTQAFRVPAISFDASHQLAIGKEASLYFRDHNRRLEDERSVRFFTGQVAIVAP